MNSDSKVFFSYAWRDLELAMRIDADLRRSGVQGLWRDRVDGQICGNFRDEYRDRIRHCEVFLVLDSPNYREHSNYCRDEIAFFEECRRTRPGKRLVVCLAEPDGAWRREELIPGQREELYVDFGTRTLYDDTGTYNAAMEKLCAFFGVSFVPWTRGVFEQDFLDELRQGPRLGEQVTERLLADYRSLDFYLLRNLPSTERRIRNLVADCEYFGLEAMFPSVLLCEYLLGQHRLEDCREELRTMQRRFPEDSRPCRWAGAADYRLGELPSALKQLLRAEQLAAASPQPQQRKYLRNIRLGILRTLVGLERRDEACRRAAAFCREYPRSGWDDWTCYCYTAQAFLLGGTRSADMRDLLEEGIGRFTAEPSLYALAGCCDFLTGHLPEAIARYREALRCADSVEHLLGYASELAVIYSKAGASRELADLERVCTALCPDEDALSDSARASLEAIRALR